MLNLDPAGIILVHESSPMLNKIFEVHRSNLCFFFAVPTWNSTSQKKCGGEILRFGSPCFDLGGVGRSRVVFRNSSYGTGSLEPTKYFIVQIFSFSLRCFILFVEKKMTRRLTQSILFTDGLATCTRYNSQILFVPVTHLQNIFQTSRKSLYFVIICTPNTLERQEYKCTVKFMFKM